MDFNPYNGNTNTKVITTAKEDLDAKVNELEFTKEDLKASADEVIIYTKAKKDEAVAEYKQTLDDVTARSEEIYSRVSLADNQHYIIHDYDFVYNTETEMYEYILTHDLGESKIIWRGRTINGSEANVYVEDYYASSKNKSLVQVWLPMYVELIANRGYYGGAN